ncbi:MAG: hypothetical protein IT548_10440 [Alphaproteobacteria bacterium]|nr:hypothetical protein [Alphaproteobacteria bacterium]
MKERVTWGERLRYSFDKSMAAGPISLIGWLSLLTLLVIVVATLILELTGITSEGTPPLSFAEGFWQSLMRTMDPGTMAGDAGWDFRLITLLITLSGIFIFSALIGILSAGINDRLSELRKGRSRVLEEGHTIILNWSPSIFDIVSELAIANSSVRHPRIVVMAGKDKIEMEDAIAAKKLALGRTKVICRSGDPTDLYDLAIVSPQTCKSIIILSPEIADPDSAVVKTILALAHDPKRRKEKYLIAAEIREAKNAHMARVVGGGEVQLVLADELIARIVVHSSRQSGLSAVYSELLDFDGCEIYTSSQPALVGKTFGDAIGFGSTCTVIGICDAAGQVKLNPPMDTPITEGTRVIVIAEDDAAIAIAAPPAGAVDDGVIRFVAQRPPRQERTLILGWNRRGPMIAKELSHYLAPGSLLTIAADEPGMAARVAELEVDEGLKVRFRECDSSDRATITALDVPSYDHVMVLSYSDTLAAQPADTRTLVTLLHLRHIMEQSGTHVSVVSEMADIRNRELAEVTRADDFVVSNKLVSLMLAQASENEYLSAIFGDLLDEEGSEICMRPAEDYVATGTPVSFHTVAEAARRRGETAFGYARARTSSARGKASGVVVNPSKTEKIVYEPGDRIVVLAEE